jgi:hypothetical protein
MLRAIVKSIRAVGFDYRVEFRTRKSDRIRWIQVAAAS